MTTTPLPLTVTSQGGHTTITGPGSLASMHAAIAAMIGVEPAGAGRGDGRDETLRIATLALESHERALGLAHGPGGPDILARRFDRVLDAARRDAVAGYVERHAGAAGSRILTGQADPMADDLNATTLTTIAELADEHAPEGFDDLVEFLRDRLERTSKAEAEIVTLTMRAQGRADNWTDAVVEELRQLASGFGWDTSTTGPGEDLPGFLRRRLEEAAGLDVALASARARVAEVEESSRGLATELAELGEAYERVTAELARVNDAQVGGLLDAVEDLPAADVPADGGRIVDVRDDGAQGDGVTDDAPALRAAVAIASADTGEPPLANGDRVLVGDKLATVRDMDERVGDMIPLRYDDGREVLLGLDRIQLIPDRLPFAAPYGVEVGGRGYTVVPKSTESGLQASAVILDPTRGESAIESQLGGVFRDELGWRGKIASVVSGPFDLPRAIAWVVREATNPTQVGEPAKAAAEKAPAASKKPRGQDKPLAGVDPEDVKAPNGKLLRLVTLEPREGETCAVRLITPKKLVIARLHQPAGEIRWSVEIVEGEHAGDVFGGQTRDSVIKTALDMLGYGAGDGGDGPKGGATKSAPKAQAPHVQTPTLAERVNAGSWTDDEAAAMFGADVLSLGEAKRLAGEAGIAGEIIDEAVGDALDWALREVENPTDETPIAALEWARALTRHAIASEHDAIRERVQTAPADVLARIAANAYQAGDAATIFGSPTVATDHELSASMYALGFMPLVYNNIHMEWITPMKKRPAAYDLEEFLRRALAWRAEQTPEAARVRFEARAPRSGDGELVLGFDHEPTPVVREKLAAFGLDEAAIAEALDEADEGDYHMADDILDGVVHTLATRDAQASAPAPATTAPAAPAASRNFADPDVDDVVLYHWLEVDLHNQDAAGVDDWLANVPAERLPSVLAALKARHAQRDEEHRGTGDRAIALLQAKIDAAVAIHRAPAAPPAEAAGTPAAPAPAKRAAAAPRENPERLAATPSDVLVWRVHREPGIVTALDLVDEFSKTRIGKVRENDRGQIVAIFDGQGAADHQAEAESVDAAIDLILADVGAARLAPTAPAAEPAEDAPTHWPPNVSRKEYVSWREAQHARGVTENVNPHEYKRLRDAGLIAGASSPEAITRWPAPADGEAPAAEAPTPEADRPMTNAERVALWEEFQKAGGLYTDYTALIRDTYNVKGSNELTLAHRDELRAKHFPAFFAAKAAQPPKGPAPVLQEA